jgi:aminomuconate-semialdehyde/2-hydroxymuconate-6-semialdehyde dehydrogenase
MTVKDRCDLLNAVADGIERRFDEFLNAEMADTGKPGALARNYDIPRGAANFRFFTDLIRIAPGQALSWARQ